MEVNTKKLKKGIESIKKCKENQNNLKENLNSVLNTISGIDDEESSKIEEVIRSYSKKVQTTSKNLKDLSKRLSKATNSLEKVELLNKSISEGIKSATVAVNKGAKNLWDGLSSLGKLAKEATEKVEMNNKSSTVVNTTQIGEISRTNMNDSTVKTEEKTVNQMKNPSAAKEPDKVPESQVLEVIKIMYGENPNLKEEEKQRIAEAIQDIKDIGILDKDLDEAISNMIIAQIVKDYLDGKIMTGDIITQEELELYIKSQPAIQIYLKLDEVLKNLESLIKSGSITKKQVETIIKDNLKLHDSEDEFREAYIKAGGTETDISKIKFFYDKENKIINIRSDATSAEITYSIICEIDDLIKFDTKTGKPIYYKELENIDNGADFDKISDKINKVNDKAKINEDINNIKMKFEQNKSKATEKK